MGRRRKTAGERIKERRLELGLSQRETAAPGISFAHISRIENGIRDPSVKALRKLAEKLQTTPSWLETGEGEPAEDLARLVIDSPGLSPDLRRLARRVLGLD